MTTETAAVTQSRKFGKVCQILEKYNYNQSKLIPILQQVQEAYRYLPEEVLTFVATSLNLSPARVYGVATFYSHFALEPKGKHVIKVCAGTGYEPHAIAPEVNRTHRPVREYCHPDPSSQNGSAPAHHRRCEHLGSRLPHRLQ